MLQTTLHQDFVAWTPGSEADMEGVPHCRIDLIGGVSDRMVELLGRRCA
jgi:hypothetical protein